MNNDDFLDHENLEHARKRHQALGFIQYGIPIDAKHEKSLDAQRLGAQPRAATSAPSLATDSEDDNDYASEQSFRGQSDPPRPRTNRSASDHRVAQSRTSRIDERPQRRTRQTDTPKLKMNQIEAELVFPGGQEWRGVFLLDTGVIDNWINEKIVKDENLPARWRESETRWYSFDNTPVTSLGMVQGSTVFENNTQQCQFRIARRSNQFNVIIGCRSLMERGLVFFTGGNPEMVAPLAERSKAGKDEKKANQHDDGEVERLDQDLREQIKWMDKMKKKGWMWDKVKNEWYKQDSSGNKDYFRGRRCVLDLGD